MSFSLNCDRFLSGFFNQQIGTSMKSTDTNPFDIQNFIDKFDNEIILTCQDGKEQIAEFCLTLESSEFETILELIPVLSNRPEIRDTDILNFCKFFIDKNFKGKNWYWHLGRNLLLETNPFSPTSTKSIFQNEITDKQFQSLSANLEIFILTKSPGDFLLEEIEIKEPSALNEKIINYLFKSRIRFNKDTGYNNWLSKNCSLLSIKSCESWKLNEQFTDKYQKLLTSSIVWGINQAHAFSKQNGDSKKIRINDLPFDLKEISDACCQESMNTSEKIQILLGLEVSLSSTRLELERDFGTPVSINFESPHVYYEHLDLCNKYPASIVENFQSWDDMNMLVEKHPIFLEHNYFSNDSAIKNMSVLFLSDPKQTQFFVIKYIDHFLRMYGSDLCIYADVYFSGKREPSASFIFLQQVLNQLDDAIFAILNSSETWDFNGKTLALSLIQTPAANRAIWSLYKLPNRPKNIVFNLDRLIDCDENFEFEEFYQLALNDSDIAYKFMQIKSQRFRYYLEYKPEMARELFKKYPGIISYMKGNVLNAVFANQENLVDFIPSDYYLAIPALLTIDTQLARAKAKEKIREIRTLKIQTIPSYINHLFQEFNHTHIIQFVNESFSKSELQSIYMGKDCDAVVFSRLYSDMGSSRSIYSNLSVELANFILENFGEKNAHDGNGSESRRELIWHCCDFLYATENITVETIFLQYSHHIFGNCFYLGNRWELELLVLLIEKIKFEFKSKKNKIDTVDVKKLVALLPKNIIQHISIEVDEPWWDGSIFDAELQRIQREIKNFSSTILTLEIEESNSIHKTDVLFDSDYHVLRNGMHMRYRQNLFEKTQDFSIVEHILFDAKNSIRTKLRNSLSELHLSEQNIESIFLVFSDENFYPSRLSLENTLKPLDLDPLVQSKLLDRCSDEILPSLLHESLKKIIFSESRIDEKSNIIVFFRSVYKDYPQGWARSLLKVLEGYKNYSHHQWIKGIAFALGELREPLGEKIPKMLDIISRDENLASLNEVICRQKMLFNRENFNRGHYRKPQRRVADALQHIVRTHQKVAW